MEKLRGSVFFGLMMLGTFSFFNGLNELISSRAYDNIYFILTICFFVLSQWSVPLPSGASFRPAMMLVTLSMLVLPVSLTPLVAAPGLFFLSARTKQAWWNYPLSIGHITAGLFAGGFLYQFFVPSLTLGFSSLHWVILALIVHLLVNRFVSAFIIAYKKKRSILSQVKMTVLEFNWCYLNNYLMSLFSALILQREGLWAFILSLVFFWSIFKSVSYYSQMHKWQKAAKMDGLTGAENRTSMDDFIEKMKVSPQTGTLAMIDLDNFKLLNDMHGHEKGDEILKKFVQQLYLHIKEGRVFRFGGDEFFLFVPHAKEQGKKTQAMIHQLIQKVEHDWEKKGLPVRASIGICSHTSEENSFPNLLSICDAAMYQKKRERKKLGMSNAT